MRAVLVAAIVLTLCTYCIATIASTGCTNDNLDNVWHRESVPRWESLSDERDFAKFRIQRLSSTLPVNTATGGGRGVAVVISSQSDVASAYVAVSKLRSVSSLRVEVFYSRYNTMNDEAANQFQSLPDVYVVPVEKFGEQSSRIATVALKSSFMDVMVIDSRTMVLSDPITLFNLDEYRSTGLLMFPAHHKTSSMNPIWQVINTDCIDSFEQSDSIIIINKAQAWNALHMAAQMKGNFFKSVTNGEQNIVRLAALASNTNFHMSSTERRYIASSYHVDEETKSCAHLTVHSMDDVDMFAVSSNAIIEESGASLPNVQCLDTTESTKDESFVSSYAQLFASLPSAISRNEIMETCTAGVKSQAEAETLAATTFAGYKVDVNDMTQYSSKYITIPYNLLIPQCVSTWPCVSSSYYGDTVDTAFINVTTGYFMSAHIQITTSSSRNVLGGVGLGNTTYLYVSNTGGTRTSCDYAGIFDTSVSYDLSTRSWAIVRVAFDARRRHYMAPITLTVTYTGDSNAARSRFALSSITMSPILLTIVAVVVTIAHNGLF